MPPSERTAAAAEPDDDIVERTPSHPVTTTLLIVASLALVFGIGLTGSELGHYVNQRTKSDLNQFAMSAVHWSHEGYKTWWKEQAQKDAKNYTADEYKRLFDEELEGDAEPVRRTRKTPKAAAEPEAAPAPAEGAEKPAEEKPAEEKPAEAPAGEGGGNQ